jgi:hypothetical protein
MLTVVVFAPDDGLIEVTVGTVAETGTMNRKMRDTSTSRVMQADKERQLMDWTPGTCFDSKILHKSFGMVAQ